jgi:hypothetical protein
VSLTFKQAVFSLEKLTYVMKDFLTNLPFFLLCLERETKDWPRSYYKDQLLKIIWIGRRIEDEEITFTNWSGRCYYVNHFTGYCLY